MLRDFFYLKGLLLAGVIFTAISGCSQKYSQENRFRRTKTFLEDNIDELQDDHSKAAVQYIVPAYRHALEILKQRRFLTHPTIYACVFAGHGSRGYSPRLSIQWLESDCSVTGIFFIDTHGKRYEFTDLFAWPEELRKVVHAYFWRVRFICLRLQGGCAWDDQEFLATTSGPVIAVPVEIFKGPIKVGLITSDGKDTNIIKAWVNKDFLVKKKPLPI